MRSRLKGSGHVERKERVQLTKRADALRERPKLRWEDSVKRDLVGGGVENEGEG